MRLFLIAMALAAVAPAAQRIEGRIWDTTESERTPLANARVTLLARSPAALLGVTRTDLQGRFAFEGEVNGEVRLEFSRNGFRAASGDSYRNADCAAGCGPFEMEMVRGGVIVGTVVDDLGEPLVRARVQLHCDGFQGPQATAVSDDRGAYRMAGLRPGLDCRLEVQPGFLGSVTVELQSDPVEVRIEAGMRRNIPFALRRASTASLRVSGVLQGVDMGPDDKALLFIHQTTGPTRRPGMTRTEVGPDGRFTLEGVRQGEYAFRAQFLGGSKSGESFYLGRHDIQANVEGLVLIPQEPWRFAGRVEFDSPPPATQAVVFFRAADGRSGYGIFANPPDFQIESTRPDPMPGEYRAELRNDDFFITEVEAGGEVYPPSAVMLSEASAASLIFRLSADFAAIRGRVKADSAGTAAAHYRVALRDNDSEGPRRVRSVQADQQGRFTFDKVAPGEYSIAAWEGLAETDLHGDRQWDEAGPAVRAFPVDAGAEIEIELTAAPAEGPR